MDDGIFTYLMDMPTSIKSFVVANNDMSFTIVINSKICHEQQLMAYQHEISHIKNGDFESKNSVDSIEMIAHKRQNIGISKY